MSDSQSCLVRYLSAYTRLSVDDHELLADFERGEREHAGGTRLKERGDVVDELLVVKRGWLFTTTDLEDGRRHVIRTYHGGDIIGLGDLAVPSMSAALVAATDVRLCPMPKDVIGRVLSHAPRLGALLLALSARDQVLLVDLLRATARMSAKDRIVFALLNWLCRLALTNPPGHERHVRARAQPDRDRRHAGPDQRLGQQGTGRARDRGADRQARASGK